MGGALTRRSIAFVTASYRGDLEQFKLLSATLDQHVPKDIAHYVLVPEADVPLFEPLRTARTRLLPETQVLPRWTRGVFTYKGYRFTMRSLPIRGWIIQQLVKLNAPNFAPEDVFLCVDSDCAFLRDFDPHDEYVKDGKVSLFRVKVGDNWPAAAIADNTGWRRVSKQLLGTDKEMPRAGYVGNIVPLKRDILLSLHDRVSRGLFRSWAERVARRKTFSEYMLYGCYVEAVLGFDVAEHFPDDTPRVLESWDEWEQTEEELAALRDSRTKDHIAVMVSCKGKTPAARIAQVFGLSDAVGARH
jgi:hypothetical protein